MPQNAQSRGLTGNGHQEQSRQVLTNTASNLQASARTAHEWSIIKFYRICMDLLWNMYGRPYPLQMPQSSRDQMDPKFLTTVLESLAGVAGPLGRMPIKFDGRSPGLGDDSDQHPLSPKCGGRPEAYPASKTFWSAKQLAWAHCDNVPIGGLVATHFLGPPGSYFLGPLGN